MRCRPRKKALQTLLARETLYRNSLPAKTAAWEATLTPLQRRALPAAVRTVLAVPASDRAEEQKKELSTYLASRDPDYRQLTKSIAALRHNSSAVVHAQTMALGRLRRTHVMIRGDFQRQGVEVLPARRACCRR